MEVVVVIDIHSASFHHPCQVSADREGLGWRLDEGYGGQGGQGDTIGGMEASTSATMLGVVVVVVSAVTLVVVVVVMVVVSSMWLVASTTLVSCGGSSSSSCSYYCYCSYSNKRWYCSGSDSECWM